LVVAAVHVVLVLSLGATLHYDRARLPRVWARTLPIDPDSLFRGRYVQLGVEVSGIELEEDEPARARLSASEDQLVAVRDDEGRHVVRQRLRNADPVAVLEEPLALFIPEHAADPTRRGPDEELWVEVTVPRNGPPRPIRLGVKKAGVLTPLE
jgi:hypothetical protein